MANPAGPGEIQGVSQSSNRHGVLKRREEALTESNAEDIVNLLASGRHDTELRLKGF